MAVPRKRSGQLTFVAVIIIGIVIGNAAFVFFAVERIKNDARTVNYTGKIRGSIQRIAKLELSGRNSDDNIMEVNRIFEDFEKGGEGPEVFIANDRYYGLKKELKDKWQTLNREISVLRNNDSPENRIRVLNTSEQSWEAADRLVSEVQSISETKLVFLRYVFLIVGVNIVAVIFIMILIRRHVRNELEFLAGYDQLTGVMNRYSFNVIVRQELNAAGRYHSALSLLMLDLDNFKMINDTFGHDVGDAVLRKFAELISDELRSSDAFFRIGGEEFSLIASETALDEAVILAERIRGLIESHGFEKAGRVSVSIGIAGYTQDETVESLMRRADDALYAAKRNGRNRVKTG